MNKATNGFKGLRNHCYKQQNEVISLEKILNQILDELKSLKQGQLSFEKRMEKFESRMEKFEENQERFEVRMEKFEGNQQNFDEKLDNLTLELRSNFKYTNDKLQEHRKVFDIVSGEIKGIKVDVDYLSSKIGKHDMELNNIVSRIKS